MSDVYADRFGGIARLYGKTGLERLRGSHVCVVGVGGVGSWTAEALARSGVGALTLIDLDDVCVTNVNRQLHALDGTIGRPKAEVLADRVRAINPECRVTPVIQFFTSSSAVELLTPGFDCLVDAIDKLSNKCLLIAETHARKIPLVTVGGAGGKRDGSAVRVSDLADSVGDNLLRLVRKKLRRDHGFDHGEKTQFGISCVYSAEKPIFPWSNGTCSTEPEPGSSLQLDCASGFGTATFVTGAFGFAAAGEAIRRLLLAKNQEA